MYKKPLRLDERLMASASYVRRGSIVADIGTDHAYIPIYLISKGVSKRAVAADINQGPLERARLNCEKHKINNVNFFLSNGFDNINCYELGITDVVICGMGGELVSKIIYKEEYLKNKDIRLILQPMTAAHTLRLFLCEHGFEFIDETLCKSNGKLYQVIVSEYSGKKIKLTQIEAIAGKCIVKKGNNQKYFKDFIIQQYNIIKKIKDGKEIGGKDTIGEKELLFELTKIASNNGFDL